MSVAEINLAINSLYGVSLPSELSNGKFDDREYYLCNEHFIITTNDEGLWRIWDIDARNYVGIPYNNFSDAELACDEETIRLFNLVTDFWKGNTSNGIYLLNERQLDSLKHKLTKQEKDMVIDRTPNTPYAPDWIPLRLREDKVQYLQGKLPCPTCRLQLFSSLTAAERHHFYCKKYGFQPSNGLYFTPIQLMMMKNNMSPDNMGSMKSAEDSIILTIEQLEVGEEFKFPKDWFKPPYTEFVLISKEESSNGEWKIVFDPLVKTGVSKIEATIPNDTRFEMLEPFWLNNEYYKQINTVIDKWIGKKKVIIDFNEDVVWGNKSIVITLRGSEKMLGRWSGSLMTAIAQKTDCMAFPSSQGNKVYVPMKNFERFRADETEFKAEYQPTQTLGNYTPEDLAMSSTIEGFQPMKFSIVGNAESDDYDKTYGKKQGAIRRRLKNKIMGQAIVGTKKGQWSARKSQELKRQYEEACEKKGLNAYKGKKTKKQKDLSKWSKQDWTTKSGKPSSETGERYLPKKAIKALTDKEYKKTRDKKRKDSKKGKQFSDQPKKIADKVAKYRAETFESESSKKPSSVEISRSSNPEKKLMAVFEDSEGKKIKTTHFGQRGADDYTKHDKDIRDERKKLYLERHGGGTTTSTKEDWKDPTTAGALSRWILWNKPSLKASFNDYNGKFGFLRSKIKVSKSAEDNQSFPLPLLTGGVILGIIVTLFLDNKTNKV